VVQIVEIHSNLCPTYIGRLSKNSNQYELKLANTFDDLFTLI